MGAGGGGDPYVGKLVAMGAVKECGPVTLLDPEEVPDDALLVPIAMMGAPTVLGEKGIGLSWTGGALALLCEKAKGGKFGARDLRRVIRKEVEDPLSEMLISGKALTSVQVDAQDGAIVLRV